MSESSNTESRLTSMHYALQRIIQEIDSLNLASAVAEEASQLFDSGSCFIFTYSSDENVFSGVGSYPSWNSVNGFELELGEGQLGHMAQFDIPEQYENNYDDSSYVSREKTGYRAALSCLLYAPDGHSMMGGMTIAEPMPGRFYDDDDLKLLRSFADAISLIIAYRLSQEEALHQKEALDATNLKMAHILAESESNLYDKNQELQLLAKRSATAIELERARISQNLHDTIKQEIAATIHLVEAARMRLPEGAADADQKLGLTLKFLRQTDQDIRNIIASLRPQVLDERGLEAAMRRYAKTFMDTSGIDCNINLYVAGKLPRDIEETLYYVFAEALQNVALHSRASKVTINLNQANSSIRLSVKDDGVGFDPGSVSSYRKDGMGLPGMRQRINSIIGGEFAINSAKGRGTTISVRIPLLHKEES